MLTALTGELNSLHVHPGLSKSINIAERIGSVHIVHR